MLGQRPAHRRARQLSIAGIFLAAFAGLDLRSAPGQGLLQQLRDEVRDSSGSAADAPSGDAEKPRHNDRHRDGSCSLHTAEHGDDFAGLWTAAAWVTLGAVTSPFWGPRLLIDDDSFDAAWFTRYPYRCDWDGYLVTDKSVLDEKYRWLDSDQYNWLLRTRVEYGDNFDDLSRLGGQVLLDTASRWGVDAEVNYVQERLPRGGDDHLWLGDCNLVYRFAQSPQVQMRTGLGVNWLADAQDTNFGFNFTYGGDWFVCRPWILSAEIDWGRLGRAALFHGRATVGLHFHRVEIYTGYDYYDVNRTPLGGPVAGIRLWY
jgi:hypothetical protein